MRFILYLFLLILSFQLQAQLDYFDKGYVKFNEEGKTLYGLKDMEGKEIIPAKYRTIEFFNDNLLIIKSNEFYIGLINLKNEVVMPAVYTSIGLPYYGYAQISTGGYYGIIDEAGKMIINPDKYNSISSYPNGLFSFKRSTTVGIVDKLGKEILATTKFKSIKNVHNGYAVAEEGLDELNKGLFGIIDFKGNYVIKPAYLEITHLAENLFRTKKYLNTGNSNATFYGVISVDGKVNIPEQNKFLYLLSDNHFLLNKFDGTYGIVNQNNEEVVPFKNRELKYLNESYYGMNDVFKGFEVYNMKHQKVLDRAFTSIIYYADEQFYIATDKENKLVYNKDWKLCATFPTSAIHHSHQGNRVLFVTTDNFHVINLTTQKEEIIKKSDNYYSLKIYENKLFVKEKSYYDLWDISTMKKTTLNFDLINKFATNGFATFKANTLMGVLDYKGDVVLPAIFSEVNISEDRFFATVSSPYPSYVNFYNEKNKNIFSIPFSSYTENFKNEKLIKLTNGNYEILDTLGKVIGTTGKTKPSFDGFLTTKTENNKTAIYTHSPTDYTISIFDKYSEGNLLAKNGYAAVKEISSGKYGYIDKIGNVKIPFQYENAGDFFEDYAMVLLEGKKAIINSKGKILVSPSYDDMSYYGDGAIGIKTDSLWGFVSMNGKTLVEPKYTLVSEFKNGYAWVKDNENWGLIDKKGKTFIPFEYKFAELFDNNLSVVSIDNINIFLIDLSNKAILPIKYDMFGNFYSNRMIFYKKEAWNVINVN